MPATRFAPAACPRLIVKIGSALLVDGDGCVRRQWLAGVVADIAVRHRAGQRIAVVSSGAIALGARRLGLAKGGRASLEDAQAAAATGQIALSHVWAELLHAEGLIAAQILVTLDDLEDRRRYLNAAATLDRLLNLGVVPVINENDSVATEEIRFGDNDRLAARIGQAALANGVILLSDIDGLYTANPGRDPDARFIPRGDAARRAYPGDGRWRIGLGHGIGGHDLEARRRADRDGGGRASGDRRRQGGASARRLRCERARHRIRRGEGRFGAEGVARPGRLTAKGRIHVDAGAARALAQGRSLLAAGATAVEGKFTRGDVVDIVGPDDALLARGLAEYDAADAAAITGRRSDALEAVLGLCPAHGDDPPRPYGDAVRLAS